MIKKIFLGLAVLAVIAAACFHFRPQHEQMTDSEVAAFKAAIGKMQPDGMWWDCGGVSDGIGCSHEAVNVIKLTARQQAVMLRLNQLPGPPATVTEQQLRDAVGMPPKSIVHADENFTTAEWESTSPTGETDDELSVGLLFNQVSNISWAQPDRFWLRKDYKITVPCTPCRARK